MIIRWNSSFSVGVEQIDEQHKQLVEHVNQLTRAITKGKAHQELSHHLKFLIDYTHFHFSTEEAFMVKYHYPGLISHREEHEFFKRELAKTLVEIKEHGVTAETLSKIQWGLVNWVVEHIKGKDVRFGEFLNSQMANESQKMKTP